MDPEHLNSQTCLEKKSNIENKLVEKVDPEPPQSHNKNKTWKKEIRKKLKLFAHNPEENCENCGQKQYKNEK